MTIKNLIISCLFVSILISACEKHEDNLKLQFEELHEMVFLPDGSTLMAGKFGSNLRLIRTDENLTPIWIKENYPWGINLKDMTWGDSGYKARITHLFAKENGNFICVISIVEGGCVLYSRTVVSEISASGEEVRSVEFEGGGFDPYNIVQYSDESLLVNGLDKFIKLNSILEKQWEKNSNESLNDIFVLNAVKENHFAATGISGQYQVFIKLLDENANDILTSVIGKTSGFGEEAGFDLLQTDDNGFLIAGRSRHMDDNYNMDGYLIRTNSSGDTLWTRRFGDDSEQYFESIIYLNDEIAVAQGHQGTIGEPDEKRFFLKISTDGEFEDTSYFNASTFLYGKHADEFLKISSTNGGLLEMKLVGMDEIFNQ